MGKIRIVLDPHKEAEFGGSRVWEVADEEGYKEVRKRLRTALEQDEELLIWVTHPAFLTRFTDLQAQGTVEIVKFELRQELLRHLGAEGPLPEVLSNEAIRELDLLTLARDYPLRSGEEPLSWALRVTLGEVWGKYAPGEKDVAEILSTIVARIHKDGPSEALAQLMGQQCQKWAALSPYSSSAQMRSFWNWLADNPFRHARALLSTYAVRGYGEVARQWLQQADITLPEIQEAENILSQIALPLDVPAYLLSPLLRNQIQKSLQELLQEKGLEAIKVISLFLPEELQQLENYLWARVQAGHFFSQTEQKLWEEYTPSWPDEPRIRRLQRIGQALCEVPLPSLLDAEADWLSAQQWLKEDYFPAWRNYSLAGKIESTQEAARSFEEWLLKHYRELFSSPVPDVGIHTFPCPLPERAASGMILLLLLDGVPALLVEEFGRRLIKEEGLAVFQEGFRLSCVPTITSLSASCLLSGRLPDQAVLDNRDMGRALPGITPENFRKVKSLEEMVLFRPGECIFYHFDELDKKWLHTPQEPLRRWLGVAAALEDLSHKVSAVLKRAREEGIELWLGCISDHGWTELPAQPPKIEVPPDQEKEITHGRVLKGEFEHNHAQVLPASQYFLPDTYTIASGYAVFGRKPQGAVHGGATPQEVVVYGFWATTASLTPSMPLGFEVHGTIRRKVPCNPVNIVLSNPFNQKIEVFRLHFPELQVETNWPLFLEAQEKLSLPAQFMRETSDNYVFLRGEIEWGAEGAARHSQKIELSLPTTGAAKRDESFESMFEE